MSNLPVSVRINNATSMVSHLTREPTFQPAARTSARRLAKELAELADLGIAKSDVARFLRNCSITAEVLQHFGLQQEARRLLNAGRRFAPDNLPSRVSADPRLGERPQYKAIVRFLSTYAHAEYFQQGKLDAALSEYDRCLDFLDGSGIKTADSLCLESFARPYLYRAYVLHQMSKEAEALASVHTALSLYSAKIDALVVRPHEHAVERIQWLRHRSVEALLLMAAIHYSSGALNEALSHTSSAQLLYVRLGSEKDKEIFADELTRAFVTLQRVAVRRGLVGRNHPDLVGMTVELEDVKKILVHYEHRPGLLRVHYELALTMIERSASYSAIYPLLEVVLSEAEQVSNPAWMCFAQSRMAMACPAADEALNLANIALQRAESSRIAVCAVDALLAKAEILLRSMNTHHDESALRCLNQVGDIIRGRSGLERYQLRQSLLTARAHIRLNEADAADESMRRAESLMPTMEFHGLRQLFQAVFDERQRIGTDLRIRFSDRSTYAELHAQLRGWLVNRATRNKQSDRQTAEALHISRGSVMTWRRGFSKQGETDKKEKRKKPRDSESRSSKTAGRLANAKPKVPR